MLHYNSSYSSFNNTSYSKNINSSYSRNNNYSNSTFCNRCCVTIAATPASTTAATQRTSIAATSTHCANTSVRNKERKNHLGEEIRLDGKEDDIALPDDLGVVVGGLRVQLPPEHQVRVGRGRGHHLVGVG